MSEPVDINEAAQELATKLTPRSFLFERARQLQEQVIPQLEAQKAQIEEAIAIYKIEMQVLEAASKVIPEDRIAVTVPEPEGNVVAFPQGGVN